jgi:branched-chain amino acid transport system substrate-binding protein
MGGAKIVPVIADTETKPDVGSTQTERLILKENVCMVVGAYNSAVCFPASEVAQRYKTPWLNMGGVKNEITTRGYEWVFRPNNMSDYDIREMIDGIQLLAKETSQTVKTYAVVYESTDWGSDAAKVFKAEATKLGWTCVLDEPVTTGQADMNAQVLKVKQANPDVLNTSFYTPEMIVFSKALAANKVNPKFGHWTVGGGAQDPAYFKAVDKSIYEYMFVQEDWDVGGPERYPWIKEIAAKVAATKPYKINSFFAQGWTAAYIAYSALEKAGSTDKEAIRQGLLSLDIKREDQTRVLMTGYLRMKFVTEGKVTNQNIYSGGTIIQYQNAVPVALAPAANRLAGAKAVFPIPDDWATRGK